MNQWLAVGLGGMLGALMRHALSSGFHLLGPTWLPIATLTANVLGCFAIGVLAGWSTDHQFHSHWAAVGVRVGLLGGLTTFSSFALDVVRLWQSQKSALPHLLAAAHVTLGLAAVAAGLFVAGKLAGEAAISNDSAPS